jgi:AcrR family transcriptional regulator
MQDCNREDPVLEAARATVLDFGVRRTTLTEVARRAGLSRMTVYRRYADAGELMRALMSSEFGDVLERAQSRAETLPPGRERIVAAVVGTIEELMDNPLMNRLLELEPEAMLPYLTERVGAFQQAARATLAEAISAGQAAGAVRPGDAGLMAESIELAVRGVVIAARALEPAPRRLAVGELERMIDGYLRD